LEDRDVLFNNGARKTSSPRISRINRVDTPRRTHYHDVSGPAPAGPREPPMISVDPDLEFVERARAGDFAAFEQLVSRTERRVYTLALRILRRREDAEDVVQETFLSAMSHLKRFRGDASFATWVLRIASNHALKILRKRRGLPTVPLEEEGERNGDKPLPRPVYIARWREEAERDADRPEIRKALDQALNALDEKHRLVFLLRDVEGMSTEETARAVGITTANVKVRLLRARLKLRERLTRAFGDPSTRVAPAHHHG
jgi:RNA polymerase sigma-70 factor (ECF subfamily)